MKVATVDRHIDRIRTQPERHFTIKATGKAFRILSSNIYKEKILAVVRELSCNAYDAHIAVGFASRPFDVHLPNAFEPYFSVRDYGPALSPHQIENVFTTYFESTKTDTNDQIGGLGLGCKSPLSYVDSFTVISRFEGMKRTYTVFFDEADTPAMAEMACEEITGENFEENGLEVRLPVRNDSFWEFRDRAEKVFRYFDVKPNVIGSGDYKHQTPEVILSGPGYNIVKGSQNARAIMGVVSYPIDRSALQLSSTASSLVGTAIDIRFEVADLDIQPGREDLSYDDNTKRKLVERLDFILNDLQTRIIRQMAKCKNEFEARRFYGSIVSRIPVVRSLFKDGKVPFKGNLIDSDSYQINLIKDFPKSTFLHYSFDTMRPKATTHAATSYRETDRLRPIARDNLRFVVDDMNGKETATRIRQYGADNDEADVWVIRGPQEEIDAFKKRLTGVQFTDISTLPKSPVAPRAPTSVLYLTNFSRSRGGQIRRTDWGRTSVSPDDGGIYVSTQSGTIQVPQGFNASNFGNFYTRCLELKLFDHTQNLYSIPKTLMKNFEGDDGWIDFFTHIRENFVAKMTAENWGDGIAKQQAVNKFTSEFSNVSGERSFLIEVAKSFGADHPLKSFLTAWDSCILTRSFTSETEMAVRLGVEIPKGTAPDLSKLWRKADVNNKYPMVKYVFAMGTWSRRELPAASDVASYILVADRNCKKVTS